MRLQNFLDPDLVQKVQEELVSYVLILGDSITIDDLFVDQELSEGFLDDNVQWDLIHENLHVGL